MNVAAPPTGRSPAAVETTRAARPSKASGAADLSAPATFVREPPYAQWAAMREAPALHYQPRANAPGFFSVTRYADARFVLRDAETFSSEWGMTLDSALGARDPAAGRMIELTDPPRHARLRRLVGAVITPQFVKQLEPAIGGFVRELVRGAIKQREVDIVAALTAPLPARVIGSLLGLPEDDWARVAALASQAITGSPGPGSVADDLTDRRRWSADANHALFEYFAEAVADPGRLARDGLIRRFLEIDVDGGRLSEDEVLLNCLNLAIGGNETTKSVAAAGLALLAVRPEGWAWLAQDQSRVGSAIEEILRYETPAMHLVRTVTRPVDLGGSALRPGHVVCVWLGAANRDPQVFADPDGLHLDREPNRHLAFTVGPHFCLGAVLARLELRALLRELITHVGSLSALSPVLRRPSNFIASVDSFHVALSTHPMSTFSGPQGESR